MTKEDFILGLKEFCDVSFINETKYQSQINHDNTTFQTQLITTNYLGEIIVRIGIVKIEEVILDTGNINFHVQFRFIKNITGDMPNNILESNYTFRYVFDENGQNLVEL
jgi:hypothetical protein